MEEKQLILKITVPKYPRKVQTAKQARPKYYYWDGETIKAKGKKLLQKYIHPKCKKLIIENNGNVTPRDLKDDYIVVGFKGKKVYSYLHPMDGEVKVEKLTYKQLQKETKYILCEVDSNNGDVDLIIDRFSKVIANSTKAGKPRYTLIKGQDMYSGTLNEFTRAKMVTFLKEFYYNSKFKDLSSNVKSKIVSTVSSSYPLHIEMEIVDTIRNSYGRAKSGTGVRWDVGNRAYPYIKTFLDFLVNGHPDTHFDGFIEDDDRLHVSGESYFFTPCRNHEDRELVFYIYKDNRDIWNNIENYID